MRKMANFMITSAVPCVVQECGQLCSSMIEVDPEAAVQFLVMPLIEKILAELPKSQGKIMLKSKCTTLCWSRKTSIMCPSVMECKVTGVLYFSQITACYFGT